MVLALVLAQLVLPGPPSKPLSPPGMVCMGECSDGPMVWRASPARGRLVVACDMRSDTCSDGRKITTERATPVPCEVAPGQWEMVPEDTGCYGVRGLESWAENTSYLRYGSELDQEAWAKIAGAAVERTGQVWRASATSGSSFFVQTTPTLAGETWTASCRIRAGTSTTIRMAAVQAAAGGSTVTRTLSPGWGTYSVTSTATSDGNAGVWLYPTAGGAGDIYVAGCWLTKTSTPGRACWGGEAPVTCAADRLTISTEGWPTTHGSIEIEFRIDEASRQFAIILDSRSVATTGFNIHYERATGRLNHRQNDQIMEGPTITLGTWYRVRLEREGGDVRMYVNGVLGAAESDWPAWSYPHQSGGALLGKHAFVDDFYLNGPIRSLRIRSYEEVSP